MGFFVVQRDEVKRYIARFTAWIERERDAHPRKRLVENKGEVLCNCRVPISKATYPDGYAWVTYSESGDAVRGFYRTCLDKELIEFPPMLAIAARLEAEKENGPQCARAEKERTPGERSSNEKHKVTRK